MREAAVVEPAASRRWRREWRVHLMLGILRWMSRRTAEARWRHAVVLAEGNCRRELAAPSDTLRHIERYLGPWTEDALKTFLVAHFTEQAFASISLQRWWAMGADALRAEAVLEGADILHRHLGRRPVVVICPHLFAAELGALRLSLEAPGQSIFLPQASASMTRRYLAARTRFQEQVLWPVDTPMRPIIRRMAQGLPLLLMPDYLHPSRTPTWSPFFAAHIATGRTAAWCAHHLDAVILPFGIWRVDGDRHEARIHEPLADLGRDVDEGTARVAACMEQLVWRAPAQYQWSLPRVDAAS